MSRAAKAGVFKHYCALTSGAPDGSVLPEWITSSDSEGRAWRDATRASIARPGVEIVVWYHEKVRLPGVIIGSIVTDHPDDL